MGRKNNSKMIGIDGTSKSRVVLVHVFALLRLPVSCFDLRCSASTTFAIRDIQIALFLYLYIVIVIVFEFSSLSKTPGRMLGIGY